MGRAAGWLCAVAILLVPAAAEAAQRIILRNLQIITDKKVLGFDEDGIRLEGGRQIKWDEVERGSVAPEQQDAFDRMLAELGDHLYRIRLRLENRDYKSVPPATDNGRPAADYKSLLSECEAVYPRYVGRQSETAYMVFQGLMWARLEAGQRAAAVEPYLDCYGYLRAVGEARVNLPGERRLTFDRETGMTPEIVPVWFDAEAAREAMPKVYGAIKRMKKPLCEASRVYYGTMALAAGQKETALGVIQGIEGKQPEMAQLRDIALAQVAISEGKPDEAAGKLDAMIAAGLEPENRALAIYWLGVAKVAAAQPDARRDGVLELLTLPALYGKVYPDLAAAGLYRSSKTLAELNDPDGSRSVRRELLSRYGQTYFAGRMRAESSPHQDSEVKP